MNTTELLHTYAVFLSKTAKELAALVDDEGLDELPHGLVVELQALVDAIGDCAEAFLAYAPVGDLDDA